MLTEILARANPWWTTPQARVARHLPFRRPLQQLVAGRVRDLDSRRALVVVGPRQVGKSVLLRQTADELLDQGLPPGNLTLVDFSDPLVLATPTATQDVVDLQPPGLQPGQPRIFLFDEVTLARAPATGGADAWSRWLKSAVDRGEHLGHRFVVTDSSAALMRGGTRESGQGRWDELHLEPLDFREYLGLHAIPGEAPAATLNRMPAGLERFLLSGGFPEHARSQLTGDAQNRLRVDVAERAIFRDLARTGLDVERVQKLFVYLMEDSGAQFDPASRRRWLTELGGPEPVDQRSLLAWVKALEDTMLVVSLLPLGSSPGARLRQRVYPKLFAADSSLVAAFSASPSPMEVAGSRGQMFEAAVFRQLRGLVETTGNSCSYGRTKSGATEVDFVLSAGRRRIGIEVKSTVGRVDPERLQSAGASLKLDAGFLVHGGQHTQRVADVTLLALRDFLLNPERVLERPA